MSQESKTKDYLEQYVVRRDHAQQARETILAKSLNESKELDRFVHEFLGLLKEDVQKHDAESLKKHAKEFEQQIHGELDYLFSVSKQDLELFLKVLKALALYRAELGELMKDDAMKSLALSELNYADVLMQNATEKIETLQLLMKKLK